MRFSVGVGERPSALAMFTVATGSTDDESEIAIAAKAAPTRIAFSLRALALVFL